MTRTLYGGSPADVLAQPTPATTDDPTALGYLPSTALTAWDSITGGTQLTDLLAASSAGVAGSAVTKVTTDSLGRVFFYGPDGYTAPIWLQDSTGNRWRIDPSDLASRTGAVSSVNGKSGAVTLAGSDLVLNAADIDDSTTVGKSLITAADASTAWGVISSAAIGTTSSTAKAGNYQPTAANISDSTATGQALMKAADKPSARTAIDAMGTADFPVSFSNLAYGDLPTYDDQAQVWTNKQPSQVALPDYLIQGEVLNPGQPVPGDWPAGAIAFVRATAPSLGATILQQGGFTTSNTTLTLTPTNSVAIGENVFVGLVGNPPSSGVTSTTTVADSGSNTYSARGARAQGTVVQALAFNGRATTALTTSSTVTATLSAAVSNLQGIAIKLTGLASPAIDQQGANSAFNTTTLTISAGGATAQASEIAVLLVGFNGTGNTITTPTGWTQIGTLQTMTDNNPKNCAVFTQVLTTVQTVSVTVNVGIAGTIVGLLNTFKAA